MTKNIKTALMHYGFSEREAVVYMTLLEKVEATVFTVAEETDIPRTTVYALLDELKRRGFISSFRKNDVKYFTPESPKKLLLLLKEKESLIEEVLPEILALSDTSGVKPIVKMYIGKEGLKTVWNDILTTMEFEKDKTLYAYSHPQILKALPRFFPDWLKRRESLGIFSKVIVPDTQEVRALESFKSNTFRETRLFPKDFPFIGTIDVYAHKVAFFVYKDDEYYSVVLESRPIANMLKQTFFFTWEMLEDRVWR